MRRKHFKRVLALVMAVAVVVGLTVPAVYAASGFDSFTRCSITVNAKADKLPKVEDITVRVYKVADATVKNGYVSYTKTPLFEPDGEWMEDVSLSSTQDEWPARAKTLAGYTAKEGFTDRAGAKEGTDFWTVKTNAQGTVTISDLSKGLYLITVDSFKSGRKTYSFTPILRCLPSLDDNREWQPDQIIELTKFGKSGGGNNGGDTTKSVTALKVWKDEGKESDRPDSITVELLRDGKLYDTKTLSKSNNWRYTWSGLAEGSTWTINEVGAPSDKYTVITEAEGTVFTITNTHTTDIDDPDTPLDPGPGPGDDPGTGGDIPPTNIDDPDVPLDPGITPDDPTDIQDPATPTNAVKLPQTGQLWWPVPVLAVAGIVFFSIGWLRSRKDESEENR